MIGYVLASFSFLLVAFVAWDDCHRKDGQFPDDQRAFAESYLKGTLT